MNGPTIKIDTAELRALLENVSSTPVLSAAVGNAVRLSLLAMASDVQRNKMSGQYLGVVTGTARRSITVTPVTIIGGTVSGAFGSHLTYVRAHEEGFRGWVNIPPHVRRLKVTRKTKSGARVTISEKQRLQYALQGLKTVTHVGRSRRWMNIRARHFMRASLHEGVPAAQRRIARAITILLMRGRVASNAEMGE